LLDAGIDQLYVVFFLSFFLSFSFLNSGHSERFQDICIEDEKRKPDFKTAPYRTDLNDLPGTSLTSKNGAIRHKEMLAQ